MPPCDEISGHTHAVFRVVSRKRSHRSGLVSGLHPSEIHSLLGLKPSTVRNDLEELQEVGLVRREGEHLVCERWCSCPTAHPDFKIIRLPLYQAESGATPSPRTPLPHTPSPTSQSSTTSSPPLPSARRAASRPPEEPSGAVKSRTFRPISKWTSVDLAKHFSRELAFELRVPFQSVGPLASQFKRLKSECQLSNEELREMIHLYISDLQREGQRPMEPWKQFVLRRHGLLSRARQQAQRRDHQERLEKVASGVQRAKRYTYLEDHQ